MMTISDLFVEKWRPKTLEDMILTPDVRSFFEEIFSMTDPVIPNLLFRGKPGGGKSTLARIIEKALGWETLHLNASAENGIETIRNKVTGFSETMSMDGKMKLVILEEADGLSSSRGSGSSAQQMLKALIEDSSDLVRYIMTVNDVSRIDAPIKSRMQEFLIRPPDPSENNDILKLIATIMKKEGIGVADINDVKKLVRRHYPDIRTMLQILQQRSFNAEKMFTLDTGVTLHSEKVAQAVLNKVLGFGINDAELMELRQKIMENENLFDGDYHTLMKSMFELAAKMNVPTQLSMNAKREVLLVIYEFMYRHATCIDKEINAFALMVKLSGIKLSGKA